MHRMTADGGVLEVRGLSVRYGRSVRALEDVTLSVAADGVLAVLGGNGAGKSTLLRAVSGTLGLHRGAVTAGEITFDGDRIDRLDPALVVRRGVVAVPEGRQVFARMSVEENLRAGGLGARSPAVRAAARERVHELFPRARRARAPAGGPAVRRRAADARDRPRPHVGPAPAAARRAVARARTADGRAHRPR